MQGRIQDFKKGGHNTLFLGPPRSKVRASPMKADERGGGGGGDPTHFPERHQRRKSRKSQAGGGGDPTHLC